MIYKHEREASSVSSHTPLSGAPLAPLLCSPGLGVARGRGHVASLVPFSEWLFALARAVCFQGAIAAFLPCGVGRLCGAV